MSARACIEGYLVYLFEYRSSQTPFQRGACWSFNNSGPNTPQGRHYASYIIWLFPIERPTRHVERTWRRLMTRASAGVAELYLSGTE